MLKLYEYGQPPAEFIEYIEPELKKMEEDPNNPMFSMLKDMMPQGQGGQGQGQGGQGQGGNMGNPFGNPQNPMGNGEDVPPECKNN